MKLDTALAHFYLHDTDSKTLQSSNPGSAFLKFVRMMREEQEEGY